MSATSAAIIGAGSAGVDLHLPRLLGLCGAQSVHLVEPDEARRRELAQTLRDHATTVTLMANLPADVRYTIAVIATPAKFRGEYVERLGDRCAKVVLECPLARNLAEADALVRQFDRCSAMGFLCCVRRSLESFRFVRSAVDERLFGDLLAVNVCEASRLRPTSLGSFARDASGGGVLLEVGSQTLGLLFDVFGEIDVKRAWTDVDQGSRNAVEANCLLEAEGDGRVPIEILLSRNRHLSNKARFTFARATLTVGVTDNSLDLALSSGPRLHGFPDFEERRPLHVADLFDAYYRQHVIPGANTGVAPRDALKVMGLIEAAYRSAVPFEGGF